MSGQGRTTDPDRRGARADDRQPGARRRPAAPLRARTEVDEGLVALLLADLGPADRDAHALVSGVPAVNVEYDPAA